MAKQRKEKETKIKLKQPDRSGPDPSRQTLLDLAEQRGLLSIPENRVNDEELEEPLVGRLGESILWSISLTMLHFTLDVLVTHQYAVAIKWPDLIRRLGTAFPTILLLIYSFHPHPSRSILLPTVSRRYQTLVHQAFFFIISISAGSYLIYITNMHGYYAVMKRAPPLGCLWIWAVIELNIFWATGSLICCGLFLKWNGYSYL